MWLNVDTAPTPCEIDLRIAPSVLPANSRLQVDLALKHNRSQTVDRAFFLQIEDLAGNVLFHRESGQLTIHYLDEITRSGSLSLPEGLEAGAYRLVLGMDGMR